MRITPISINRNTVSVYKKQNVCFGRFDNDDKTIAKPLGFSLSYQTDRDILDFLSNTPYFIVKMANNASKTPYLVKDEDAIEKSPNKDKILEIFNSFEKQTAEKASKKAEYETRINDIKKDDPNFVSDLNYSKANGLYNRMSGL